MFGDEKDRTKTLALSSRAWLEFFKGEGGGTYHSHPTSMLHYPVFFLMDNSSAYFKTKEKEKKIFPGDLVSVGTLGNLLYLLAIPLSLILSF